MKLMKFLQMKKIAQNKKVAKNRSFSVLNRVYE